MEFFGWSVVLEFCCWDAISSLVPFGLVGAAEDEFPERLNCNAPRARLKLLAADFLGDVLVGFVVAGAC